MLGSGLGGHKMTRAAGTATTTTTTTTIPFEPAAEPGAGELAGFLRRMRERADPQSPGLPREEVAQAAGISATWYTWLEQGRRVRASVEVLDALAQALRLDTTERDHLLALARPDLHAPFAASPAASDEALARWVASLP